MDNKKEVLYEVYEEIVTKYKGWQQIGEAVKQIAKSYEKQFVCELTLEQLNEVSKKLKVGINYWKGKTKYVKQFSK